ncbi:MAG: PaaI family thioesterase [Prevotella sp.]|nr:PaaI family thioesterase [Prevotella sp.]
MNIDDVKDSLVERDGLSRSLGIEFFSTSDAATCGARMRVDERNCQPSGLLSGGAMLAMAEHLAGVGSAALCPGRLGLGINVSGSHVRSVSVGGVVTAEARLLHRGGTLHHWHVEVRNESGDLVSTVEVTNFMVDR